jgi:hypothetical protein
MKRQKNRFWKFLTGTNVSVLWLVLATVVQLIANFLISDYLNQRAVRYQVSVSEKSEALKLFREHASEFSIHAGNFAQQVTANTGTIETAKAPLVDNLIKQYNTIEEIALFVSPEKKAMVDQYSKQIQKTVTATRATNNVLTAADFWEETQKLLELKKTILPAISNLY